MNKKTMLIIANIYIANFFSSNNYNILLLIFAFIFLLLSCFELNVKNKYRNTNNKKVRYRFPLIIKKAMGM